MENKGFAEQQTNITTPNSFVMTEKPLKNEKTNPKRVDINILKSKLQQTENKEFKRNSRCINRHFIRYLWSWLRIRN